MINIFIIMPKKIKLYILSMNSVKIKYRLYIALIYQSRKGSSKGFIARLRFSESGYEEKLDVSPSVLIFYLKCKKENNYLIFGL